MTPEEMRIAIAEACGWKRTGNTADGRPVWTLDNWTWVNIEKLPDYCNDLNAMNEAERALALDKWMNYLHLLSGKDATFRVSINAVALSAHSLTEMVHATAAQRAEAFCRVMFPERFPK